MLPTNGGEALVVIAAILLQLTLPLTPAQVLWINMVTSATLGLALAFEPAEGDVMARRPRSPSSRLLSGFFIWRVLFVSVLMMLGAFGLFYWELQAGTSVEYARTMAVNAVVMAEMFYLLNSRFILAPRGQPRGAVRQPLRPARHRRLRAAAAGLHLRRADAGHLRLHRPGRRRLAEGAAGRRSGIRPGRTGEMGNPP